MKPIVSLLVVIFWSVSGLCCIAAQSFEQLDESEQQAMADTFQYALENTPTDQNSTWVNPDSSHSGEVKPIRTFYNRNGVPCREFTQTVMIGDREELAYGTACRQPDGSWQIVADEPEKVAEAQVSRTENRTVVYVYDTPWPNFYMAPYVTAYPFYYPVSFFFNFDYIYSRGHFYERPYRTYRYYYDKKKYPSGRVRTYYDRYRKEQPRQKDIRRDRGIRSVWRNELRYRNEDRREYRNEDRREYRNEDRRENRNEDRREEGGKRR